jgi:large subunit ribosomal protein L13
MKEIDAQNRTMGRVATEAAMALMGKDKPTYQPNKVSGSKVKITNASKMKVTAQRIAGKSYQNYSGYPGGQKISSMAQVIAKKGYSEVLKKAIKGMIPRNRLQRERMNNLTITE